MTTKHLRRHLLYHLPVGRVAGLFIWTIILLTAGLPLAWIALALVLNPSVVGAHLAPTPHHAVVFTRTLLLAAGGATLATILAIPPAALLARSGAGLLLPIMAAALAIPQPAWAYGWGEVILQVAGLPAPSSLLDLARVVITNATAWWPIPAAAIALAWRRLPASILDTAAIEGARGRITVRLLAGPALAGWSGALLLSAQNLSPPDQTGMVVASVIVRDTFQGTQSTAAPGGAGPVLADQGARLAAAIAVGLPSVVVTAGLALIGWRWFGRAAQSASHEYWVEAGGGPVSRRSVPVGVTIAAAVIVVGVFMPPLLALLRTSGGFDPYVALEAHGGSLRLGASLALGSALTCAGVALLATLAPPRGAIVLSLACFLLGGQLVALGMIRAFLPPAATQEFVANALGELYGTPTFHRAAHVALFAWLALAAGAVTWGGSWRALRELARAEGAGPLRTALHVVWPLAWPGLLAATLAVFALAMTESQATALLVPGTPINFMLSNIHTQSYAPMAEAALLMMLLTGGSVAGVVLAWQAVIWWRDRRDGRMRAAVLPARAFALLLGVLVLSSCDAPAEAPEAVWAESGAADGQLAYPRAITYSPADDTIWVVDKSARVQQYDSEGNFLRGWRMPEQQYGKPVGISVDREGNVWVADTHYYRVIVYRPDGTEWFRFGEKGVGPGQFNWPTDVLVLDDGRVLVSEYGSSGGELHSNDRIQVFARSGDGTISDARRQLIGQIGSFGTGPGEFRRPQSMAMVGEVLWVTDGANHRLLAFSLDGTLLRTVGGQAGGSAGQFRFPYGLDIDDEGMLLVSEFGNHRVQKIDPETGETLAIWGGSFGARPGQLKYPWGVAWDTKRNRAIVLDSGNDRMQVIRLRAASEASEAGNFGAKPG